MQCHDFMYQAVRRTIVSHGRTAETGKVIWEIS